jgi:hypothetical protein
MPVFAVFVGTILTERMSGAAEQTVPPDTWNMSGNYAISLAYPGLIVSLMMASRSS